MCLQKGDTPTYADVTFREGSCPENYEKIEQDMNQGARGKTIYPCLRKVNEQDKQAVSDIQAVLPEAYDARNNKWSCPASYTKDENNLNEGSGGKYIYTCKQLADIPQKPTVGRGGDGGSSGNLSKDDDSSGNLSKDDDTKSEDKKKDEKESSSWSPWWAIAAAAVCCVVVVCMVVAGAAVAMR